MKKIISLSLFCFLIINAAIAQQYKVEGRVLDDSTGEPVVAATIRPLHGKTIITNSKGGFKAISNILEDTVMISAVGYQPITVLTGRHPGQDIIIRLRQKVVLLEQVQVSTGYQTIPKERATGSFEAIDNKLLNRATGPDIINRLEGVTSIFFNHTTQNRQLFIHGISTLNAGTEPLIILDNFPYEGNLENIDPDNIESITILKDAAAASIWGAKAANGVIVITSKKGTYNQPLAVHFNNSVIIGKKPDLMQGRNYMATPDFMAVEKFLFDKGYYNSTLSNTYTYPVVSPVVELLAKQRDGLLSGQQVNSAIDAYSQIDLRSQYLKYLYRPSVTQQYHADFTGGSSNINYDLGAGYNRNITSVIGNDGFDANLYSRINMKLFQKLELESGITYTIASDNYNGISNIVPGGGKNFMYPYAQLADNAGNALAVGKDYREGYTDTTGAGSLLDWKYRPLNEVTNNDNTINRSDINLNLGLKYAFSKSFTAEIKGQMEKASQLARNYNSTATYFTRNIINRFTQKTGDALQLNVPMGGIIDKAFTDLLSTGVRGQLNYSGAFGKWYRLNAIAGAEIRNTIASTDNYRTYGYDDNVLTFSNVDYNTYYSLWDKLGSAVIDPYIDFNSTNNRYVSYFTNASFTINNKYIISGSGRKDASNLFGVNTNQKWNPFWSVGAAWKISDESFYHFEWLSSLKARVTYGYSGNIIPGLSGKPVISYSLNDVIPVPYANALSPANPDLRWEKTGTLNVGIDFTLKGNRISGSFDLYKKKSKDLFGYEPIDPTIGISIVMLNSANLSSNGFDCRLNAIIINREFKWESQLLVYHVKNRVTKYLNEYSNKGAYAGFGYTITPIPGMDPYALISYKWSGLDPQTGDPQGYLNGDISKDYAKLRRPASFADLSIKGTTRPTFYGSIRNTFSMYGFSVSANITYAFGYYFRRTALNYYALYRYWSMNKEFGQRWQKPGDELKTDVPSMIYPANSLRDNFYTYSEATVEKGDNIRLMDVRIGYTFRDNELRKSVFKGAEIYFYANNLGILWRANKLGIDPDYGTYIPAPATFSLGFKTTL